MEENLIVDDLQIKGLKLYQDNRYFKFGIDSVLLSDFAKIKKNSKAVDFGSGNGILPFLIYAKNENVNVVGIEIQKELFELSQKSINLNGGCEGRVSFKNIDIKEASKIYGKCSFDYVVTNPPYMKSKGLLNGNKYLKFARHEILITLDELVKSASDVLSQYGTMYMVNRPERLADVMHCLREYNIEPKEIRFIAPKIGKAPNLFLVRARKNSKPDLKMRDTLYIYDGNGNYTSEVLKIYGKR